MWDGQKTIGAIVGALFGLTAAMEANAQALIINGDKLPNINIYKLFDSSSLNNVLIFTYKFDI